VALSTTKVEYIALSVRSSVASQDFEKFIRSRDEFYDDNQSGV
jgi:hypothetical protein